MRHRLATIVASAALVAVIATVPAGAFADVDDDAFYADAVLWMHEAGITTGTSPACFSPKAVVTRGQAAAFLHRLEPTGR